MAPTNPKPWWQSRTIVSALVSIIAFALLKADIEVPSHEIERVTDLILELLVIVGQLGAWYFRVIAKRPVGNKTPKGDITLKSIIFLMLLAVGIALAGGCSAVRPQIDTETGDAESAAEQDQAEWQDARNDAGSSQHFNLNDFGGGRKPVLNTRASENTGEGDSRRDPQLYFDDLREEIVRAIAALGEAEGDYAEQIDQLQNSLDILASAESQQSGTVTAPTFVFLGNGAKMGNFVEQTPSTAREGQGATGTVSSGPAAPNASGSSTAELEQKVDMLIEAVAALQGGQIDKQGGGVTGGSAPEATNE